MRPTSKIRVLTLEGSAKERGRIHGEMLKTLILEAIERYKYLMSLTYKRDPEILIGSFLTKTNFLSAAKKWTPHLINEIKGIAEGVGVNFKEIFALNLAAHDEKWWFSKNFPIHEKCSSLGCFKEGTQPTLLAQNLDLSHIFEGLEVLFRIKYEETSLEVYVLSHAGFLGEFGMSNQPVGICCNSLTNHLNNSPEGLPFTFIIRSALEQPNLEKAIKFIKKVQHASAQSYILGGSERVVCLECSANKVSQFEPFKNIQDFNRVYHTNHPIENDDLIKDPWEPKGIVTTYDRFDYLKARLRDSSKKVSVDTIKHILSSHLGPVCVHHDNQPNSLYTYSSVIYSLSTPPSLYITVGPPCLTKYEKFEF